MCVVGAMNVINVSDWDLEGSLGRAALKMWSELRPES